MTVTHQGAFDGSALEDLKASFVQLDQTNTNPNNAGSNAAVQAVKSPLSSSGMVFGALQALANSGAITPGTAAFYVVTKAGVAALTLAAPAAGTDDGKIIVVTSSTANAHTLTATGLLQTGSASVNLATFAAQPGAGLILMAFNGKWNVLAQIGITFT